MHEFSVDFQREVLRLMMSDEVFAQQALRYLDKSFFSIEALGWAYRCFSEYWLSHLTLLPSMVLREELRRCSADKQTQYAPEVEHLLHPGGVAAVDYLKSKLTDFVRVNLFAQAHRQSAELFSHTKYAESYDVMALALDKIRDITFERPKRQWYFEELAERQISRYQERYDLRRMPWSTGIDSLDRVTNGGVQEGEVWAVLAYAKRGKTTFLVNQGGRSCRMERQPTLHIQLEGHGKQTAAKYDAWFSREQYNLVKLGDIRPETYNDMVSEFMRLRELLVIRTLNDWSVSMDAIVAEYRELRARGFKPRRIILDYVDLLRSRNSRVDSETQHQVEASRDFKRFVNEEELQAWTAWQAQRGKDGQSMKQHVLTSNNVADAYAKVRIVDSFGSINATNSEWDRGEMRVYWENHRDAPVGRMYLCKNDLSTMRMLEWCEEMAPDVQDSVGASS